jgi:hypothetical protein
MNLPKRLTKENLRKLDGHLDQALKKGQALNLVKMSCLNENLNECRAAKTNRCLGYLSYPVQEFIQNSLSQVKSLA